jgi:hypothetical protein
MSETQRIILPGHAYRPTKNPYGQKVISGCECGEHLVSWATNDKTARFIHAEHKKAIVREGAK